MTHDDEDYEPGALVEHGEDDPCFSFCMSFPNPAIERADTVFEEMGYVANGHTWDAAVAVLVRLHAPDLAGKLNFSSEGGMFCVESSEPEALKQVAQLIRDALQNLELLKEALKNADPELF